MEGIFIVPDFVGWLFLFVGLWLLGDVFIFPKKTQNSNEFLFNNRSFNATKLFIAAIILNLFSKVEGTVLAAYFFYWFCQLLLYFDLFLLIYYYLHSTKKLSIFGFSLGKLPVYSTIVFFVLMFLWNLLGNKFNLFAFPYLFYFISMLVLLVHYIKRPKDMGKVQAK